MYLSLSLSLYLSLSIYLSIYLSLSFSLSLYKYIYIYIYTSARLHHAARCPAGSKTSLPSAASSATGAESCGSRLASACSHNTICTCVRKAGRPNRRGCAALRCRVERCDLKCLVVAWRGVPCHAVQCSAVQCSAVLCRAVPCDAMWRGVAWCDVVWRGVARCGVEPARCYLVYFKVIWYAAAFF